MADAKQGKTPMEDFYNGASQSRVVLAKPRLGGFGASSFASSSSKSCNPFGSVLRPSTLKPGSNPFLKVAEKEEAEKDEKSEGEEQKKESKEEEEAPKFVPLGSANVTPRTTNPVPTPAQPTSSSSSGFVFGQNLSERVVIQENVSNGEATTAVDHSSTNGTSELLFTSAAATVKENTQEEVTSSDAGGGSLAASAAEYERSHARPPPPAPAPAHSLTGEEGEINVLQISCRLFAWESGSWRERGRGVLRLNDAAADAVGTAARLVVRVAGSLRVVLNTKLWADMVVQRAGTKSLRITAADAQNQVKLFLIMGAPGDIMQLYRALSSRVALSKKSNPCPQNAPSQTAAERLEAATDDNEFIDKHDKEIEDPPEDITEETTKDIAEDTSKDIAEDTSKDIAEDTSRDIAEITTKDIAQDTSKDIPEDTTTDITEDITENTTHEITKDISEDTTKVITEDITEDTTKDITQDTTKDTTKDTDIPLANEAKPDQTDSIDNQSEDKNTKSLKRKEPTDDETEISLKRQCPDSTQ